MRIRELLEGTKFKNDDWIEKDGEDSKLSYYVTIELELFPGTSIPSNAKSALACNTQKEKIKEAYANLFGYIYRPGELYVPQQPPQIQQPPQQAPVRPPQMPYPPQPQTQPLQANGQPVKPAIKQ